MLNEIAVRIQVRVYIKPLVSPVSGTLYIFNKQWCKVAVKFDGTNSGF